MSLTIFQCHDQYMELMNSLCVLISNFLYKSESNDILIHEHSTVIRFSSPNTNTKLNVKKHEKHL